MRDIDNALKLTEDMVSLDEELESINLDKYIWLEDERETNFFEKLLILELFGYLS
jgi:hypothetical protein